MDSFSLLGICTASITILCTLLVFVYRKKFKSNPQNEPKVSSSSRNWEHHVFSSFSSDDVPISFRSGIWNELRRGGFERFIDNEIKEDESIGHELRYLMIGSRIAIVILYFLTFIFLMDSFSLLWICAASITIVIDNEIKEGESIGPELRDLMIGWRIAIVILFFLTFIFPMDSFSLLRICAASVTILCTLLSSIYRKKFKSKPQNEPKVSSSSRNWEHHVFFSFNSEDIPKSFRIGIWNELRRMGFEQLFDSLFKEGDYIGPELRDAIRGSRIAIVILSENYYSSLRCRYELVEIINCRKELGQSVVTIFYEGDPIYVKHATDLGRYRQVKATAELLDKAAGKQIKDGGETFGETCEHITEEDKEERQIKALKEVAAINGYHFRYGDDETAVIEKIANNISNILNTATQSSDFEGLVGMETHREEILCMDSDKTKTFEEKWQELIKTYLKEDIYTSKRALEGTSKALLHTVYICCEDTLQYSFASHLCKDFCRKGIDASVNCNETLDVIERVSALVVVFSKNCFSSTSYVYNLVMMLQLRRKTSQLVVPVFYGISPSDVMMQEHESGDRIKEWNTALHELIELPGYYSREESSECELVEEIVKSVHEKLFPADQVGINSRLLEIEHLLCKQPWGIRRLGIWGMPGIGKTTIAKAFYDQISGRYEASCFIKHFDKAFIEKGAHCLLEEHFGEILKELPRVCSSITRPSFLGDKLKKKRTLVVLDDVQNPLVSESFLGGIHWFSPGSLIIITSRDKQVFHHCQINHVYEVRSLTEKEALQLFHQCVCVKDMRKQNLLKLSMEVVDYANGNPLALSVYGRELKGKKFSEMETKFLKLKLRAPYEIHDLFTSSYETLNDIEKNIFLDIACFFEGENVDYVIQLLEGCGFFPRVGIHVLEEKCLVTISENKLKMHRIIQDFGREVSDGETVQIERFRRLWEPLTVKFLLEDDELKASGDLEENGGPSATYTHALGTEDIEGIFLDTSNLIFDVKPGAFQNMLSLRFLNIHCSSYESCNGLRLPKGLESLPYELRLLHWENYPLQSLPQDFDPCHLVELNLPYSQLQKLWGGTKNLRNLKIARLCHSQQLTEINDICKGKNIELIDLQGCTKLHIFPAMGQLKHLRVVNLSGCTEIRSFPKVSPNIEELHLQGTGITELPISTLTLSQHVKLNRELSNHLTEFPGVSDDLNHDRLTSLVKAVSSNQHLGKLVCLNMKDCVQLKSLPHMADLESLKVLNLSGCSELEDIKGFPRNLKELYLAGTAIKELPPLPLSVEVVNAHDCVSLTSIPIRFEQLPRYYTFSNCFALSAQVVHLFVKNALTNVERIARKYQQEQNLNKSQTFSFTVPSLAMEKITFDMHSGSSVMIQLSSSWRNTLGFAILVEIAFSEDYQEDSGFGISCVYRWKDKNFVSHRLEKTFHCWTPGKGVPKDHVFVFCDFNMHPSTCEGIDPSILADLVVFEFFIVSNQKKFLESCTVTKCGVYVINASDLDTNTNVIKSFSSSEDYLQELSDNEVRDILRVIRDGLDENERTLFVYISRLFNDGEAHSLAPLIASNSLGISSGLKNLADKSLIHISPYGVLVRHGLLQKIGREFVHRQSTLSDSLVDEDFRKFIYQVLPPDVRQQVGNIKSDDEKRKRVESMGDVANIVGADSREWYNKGNMIEYLPHSFKMHASMCSELKKFVARIITIFPNIKDARPGSSEGIHSLCLLQKALEKAKQLFHYCSVSSKLYMAVTGDAILSRACRVKKTLEQILTDILNMVPTVLAVKISQIVQDLRSTELTLESSEEDAGEAVRDLMQRSTSSSVSSDEIRDFHFAALQLQISTPEDIVVERRSLRSLLGKLDEREVNRKPILKYLLCLLKQHEKIVCENHNEASFSHRQSINDNRHGNAPDAMCSEEHNAALPEQFKCPLSLTVMYDPVIISSGHTFERMWIQKWFDEGNTTCPKSKRRLDDFALEPNVAIKNQITKWCAKHGLSVQDPVREQTESSQNIDFSIASFGSSLYNIPDLSCLSISDLSSSYSYDSSSFSKIDSASGPTDTDSSHSEIEFDPLAGLINLPWDE